MQIIPNNHNSQTVVKNHICAHHTRHPNDVDYPGCTCSGSYSLISPPPKLDKNDNELTNRINVYDRLCTIRDQIWVDLDVAADERDVEKTLVLAKRLFDNSERLSNEARRIQELGG